MSQNPIITLSDAGLQSASWQQQFRNAVTDVGELGRLLQLDLDDVETTFDLKVPRAFVARMRRGDRNDPLLRQVLPINAENELVKGYTKDPLEESAFGTSTRGIIQKYQGRVLIVATGSCAVNCRYCFRRHFPYDEEQSRNSDWEKIVEHIASDPSIEEVIFSGGDPLVLQDDKLGDLTRTLAKIDHVHTLRFHTRLPVVIPDRIDDQLLRWVEAYDSQLVFVLHINHANEVDKSLTDAINRLRSKGVTLLNQSVLLKGVNDSADDLTDLSRRLFSAGVLPYYLHLLDPVEGAQHFDVDQRRAQILVSEIIDRLPGYLVPKLVKEVPGEKAKQLIPLD